LRQQIAPLGAVSVQPINLKIRAALFLLIGLVGFAAALLDPSFRVGLGVGIVCFFLAGTTLSKATQIAHALRPLFLKKQVRVEVWGMPLPAPSEASLELDSIKAFGAGLLFHLRAGPGAPRTLLKVAQPGTMRLEGGRIEIDTAAYVSWAGTRLKPAPGAKMPALVLVIERAALAGSAAEGTRT
jgi:hypothetical protein